MKQEKDGAKHTFFYDSYALLEIAHGGENYEPYTHGVQIVTTIMNLYEAYYILLQKNLPYEAETVFERFFQFCVHIDGFDVKEAARFRLLNAKKKLSYVDALGYIIAQQKKALFLTGDDAFKGLANVEFVK